MSRPDIPLTWLFALSFLLGALAVVGRSSAEGEPPADAVVELFGEELRADSGSAVGIADLDRDGVDELVIAVPSAGEESGQLSVLSGAWLATRAGPAHAAPGPATFHGAMLRPIVWMPSLSACRTPRVALAGDRARLAYGSRPNGSS